jgi:thiol-disulfide isomerase/thioredoxin
MIKIETIEELDGVSKIDKTGIILYKESCPVCDFFIDEMSNWEDEIKNFVFYKMSLTDYKKERKIHFETMITPALSVYRNGEMAELLIGQAPKENVIEYFAKHNDGSWKSQDEIEKEQMERLDR